MSRLAEVHAVLSGLKSLVTAGTAADIETARRSMGGHGYSAYTGLGRLYADYVPTATYVSNSFSFIGRRDSQTFFSYEGDNYVLDQQVVRAALKAYKALQKAEQPPGFGSALPLNGYLRHTRGESSKSEVTAPDPLNWDDHKLSILLLELRAARIVEDRAVRTPDDVDASFDQRISRAVTEAYIATHIGEMIAAVPLREHSASVVRSLLRLVCNPVRDLRQHNSDFGSTTRICSQW